MFRYRNFSKALSNFKSGKHTAPEDTHTHRVLSAMYIVYDISRNQLEECTIIIITYTDRVFLTFSSPSSSKHDFTINVKIRFSITCSWHFPITISCSPRHGFAPRRFLPHRFYSADLVARQTWKRDWCRTVSRKLFRYISPFPFQLLVDEKKVLFLLR